MATEKNKPPKQLDASGTREIFTLEQAETEVELPFFETADVARHELVEHIPRGIQKLKLKHSERTKLLEEIKLMMEKKIMVKDKPVMLTEIMAKKTCTAEKVCIVLLGEDILCFVDSSTEIKRLSINSFCKLSEEMQQSIISTFEQKCINIRMERIINSEEKKIPNCKKNLFKPIRGMNKWKEKFLNTPCIRNLFKDLIQMACDKEILSEESLEVLSEMIYFKWALILQTAVNQQRLTCNRKLCIQHFPLKFEGVSYNFAYPPKDQVSQKLKILHKEISLADKTFYNIKFENIIKRKDFKILISSLPKEPVIRNLTPSFANYLLSDGAYHFPMRSLHMISTIFSCPYYPFFNPTQMYIVIEYVMNCLLSTATSNRQTLTMCQKIGEIINKIEDKLPFVHRAILQDLKKYLSNPLKFYNFCYGILVAMKSMNITTIAELLFETFEKIAKFVAAEGKHKFYFLLLDVCELFVAQLIESKGEFSLGTDYCVAYQSIKFFGSNLILRLTPAFRRYEARIFKEMKYRFEKFNQIPIDGKFVDLDIFFQDLIKNPQKLKQTTPEYSKRVDYVLNEFNNKLDESEYVSNCIDYRLGFCDEKSVLCKEYPEYIKFLQNIPGSFLDEKNQEILLNRKKKKKRTCTGDLSIFI